MALNEVHGGASAYVLSTNLTGGSLAVTATDNATITAANDVSGSASGGSVFGGASSGTTLAVNATIATNQMIGSADAHVKGSTIVSTAGDVSVIATNSDIITATTKSAVTVGGNGSGTAVGILMAFNTIGAEINNLLSLAVNAIVAADVLGSSTPSETTAYIQDSDVSSGGALTVQATSQEQITSSLSNDATADAVAFANANGFTANGTLGSNEVHALVTAYVDNHNSTGLLPTAATVISLGAMLVQATDSASITTSSELTSVNSPTNDGGASLINHYADLYLHSYQYTDASGFQNLNFGDTVWVNDGSGQGTGSVFAVRGNEQHGQPHQSRGDGDRLHQSRSSGSRCRRPRSFSRPRPISRSAWPVQSSRTTASAAARPPSICWSTTTTWPARRRVISRAPRSALAASRSTRSIPPRSPRRTRAWSPPRTAAAPAASWPPTWWWVTRPRISSSPT